MIGVQHYAIRRAVQAEGVQIPRARSPGRLKFVRWLFSVGLPASYRLGAWKFEVACRFLDNLCIPGTGVMGGPSNSVVTDTDIPV